MAAPDRAERRKPLARFASGADEHAQRAYVAEIVSLEEIVRHKHALRGFDEVAQWLARRQLGLAATEQLHAAGVGRGVVVRRTSSGFLHRLYRGVYLVGHPIPVPGARELGAVLACGRGTFVCGRAAAGLWAMIAPCEAPVDVTVVRRGCRMRDNVRVHAVEALDARDHDTVRGIPVTAPARTVIDFAADASDDELEAAISEARALKLIKDGDLESALGRAGSRRGATRVRRLLRTEDDRGYTRSKAERLMRRLAREAGVRQPLCNRRLEGYSVDFLWPDERLVVEVDGYQFHGHRGAFERDRKKDQVLTAAGYRVIRVTWLQLRYEPIRVAAAIAAALAAGRARG